MAAPTAPMGGSARKGASAGAAANGPDRAPGGGCGELVVVGTPIGNLGDLSPRAAAALAAADVVCCEDTRVTGKLLAASGIRASLMRCDENVIAARAPQLIDRMLAGERVAFASDAGMPGVSDPGQVLVDAARGAGVPVTVVPGPVACVTALVASGIPCDHFFFEGFLPRRAGERAVRLAELASVPGALIFYESPHRVEATLASIAEACPGREVALCRELTKLHEEVLRAPACELAELVRARGQLKGEMAIVVAPPSDAERERRRRVEALASSLDGVPSGDSVELGGRNAAAHADPDALLRRAVADALAAGEPPSRIAKSLSQRFSCRKREVYELALSLRDEQGRD